MADTLPFDPTRKPELDKPGKRKALNRSQIIRLVIRQIGPDGVLRCGCGCGEPLDPVCIDEHLTPRETLPADRADNLDNRALFNPECSKAKTKLDQAVIGHWRRARGDSGQRKRREENGSKLKSNPKIQSRGFSKQEARLPLNDRPSRNPNSWNKPASYVSPLSKEYRRKFVPARVKPVR